MIIRVQRILTKIGEEVESNLPKDAVIEYYRKGREKMAEYLSEFEIDDTSLDNLADRVADYYSNGYDLDTAALYAASDVADKNEHWKDVAESDWFSEVDRSIRQTVGYIDVDDLNEYRNLPGGLSYLRKEQIVKNEEELKTAVLNGLLDGEEVFLEDAIRGFLREFQESEDVKELNEEVKEEVKMQEKEEKEEKEEETPANEEPSWEDFVQETEDYSGRFAHAAV